VNDDEIDERIAAMTAEMDQAMAGIKNIADALATFRRQLVDGGFSPYTAEQLCRAWFGSMFQN
jgi:hypothetical protein